MNVRGAMTGTSWASWKRVGGLGVRAGGRVDRTAGGRWVAVWQYFDPAACVLILAGAYFIGMRVYHHLEALGGHGGN